MMSTEYMQSLLIAGEWREPVRKGRKEVTNPATGEVIAVIGHGDSEDALMAVQAAEGAFPEWSATSVRTRANILNAAAGLLRQRADHIGHTLASETGKPLAQARGEVNFAAEYFQWFAEEIRRPHGYCIPSDAANRRHIAYTQPAGVALCLTPWNFPVSIQARKIAPALAAGCTVVARASDEAPLSVLELFRCIADAGVPGGAANLVLGPASVTTEAMMKHPAVRVVSFTGSTAVGRTLMHRAADGIVRLALELGGDAPFIVFDDADVVQAVEGAMIAKFRNNGQSCIAANRFYVHEEVYDQFVTLLAEKIAKMKIGNPVGGAQVDLGPLINLASKARVEGLVHEAEALGGKHLVPEMEVPAAGYYVAPAIMENVPESAGLAREELFAPVAPVFKFADEAEVIKKANNTDMGLAAYVYTGALSCSARVTEALRFGIIGLNNALPSVAYAPMGGVKQSGLGREGARTGLEEFMDIKYVATDL
ncbi:Aldehyde dehydrogenase family [Acididesulfobacillus acetoxydans]|uniref:Aldehyde dehydrogenase family n=2 Tax=Acididesulfobacillus acetoxydans TaxID=1561005 RepID=A0A8S0WA14_9FIRM|nr:NAD-dependent succinate-semialdehyde dehydrogenase [Acididesulfobacillus acetoxydans]CAA7603049.1 Aldehyde dehydrogenase family [Acididesulfobacillus acetoxydans]CEJ09008.1 Succinate-semialdehyde dehydrogenase [NADP(+)] GabD [Acididesulfobacillus acetoxydans]